MIMYGAGLQNMKQTIQENIHYVNQVYNISIKVRLVDHIINRNRTNRFFLISIDCRSDGNAP